MAMERIRARGADAKVGIVLNFTPVTPIGSSPAALDRQQLVNDIENRWYVDPISRARLSRTYTRRPAWMGAARSPRRRHGR